MTNAPESFRTRNEIHQKILHRRYCIPVPCILIQTMDCRTLD